MGVFSKLKDVLFDVEEDEIPVITKDDKKVEFKEESPIKEVKMPKDDFLNDDSFTNDIEEIPSPKKSNFSFPLDDDFEDELPVRSKRDYFDEEFTSRTPIRETRKEEPVKKKDEYEYDYSRLDIKDVKKVESKSFKPSPVISPVYGILDQNYTKDDVIVKSDGLKRKDNKPDLDDVRKKAYGSKKKVKEEDEFEEPLRTLDEILIDKEETTKVEEVKKPVKNPVVDEDVSNLVYDDELPDEPYADEEVDNKSTEDDLESDLFNLIDSMYEEKNERDGEE